jgi:hypothetical protein
MGDGGTTNKLRPFKISTGGISTNVKEAVAGWSWSWAILQDGTVKCIGAHRVGECVDGVSDVGDVGGITYHTTPQRGLTLMVKPGDGKCDFGESSITEASDCARDEACHGGGDEDGDGLVDCDDSDCDSAVICGGGGGNPPPADTAAPTAPGSLVATVASSSQINLTWSASTDNVGVTGYKIERCSGASCSSFTQVGTSTGASYSSTGLTASTSYSFRVRANDAAGNPSSASSTATKVTSAASSPTVTHSEAVITNIPDGSYTGITRTLTATDTRTISSLNLKVNITHGCRADLKVYLSHGTKTNVLVYDGGSTCSSFSALDLTRTEFNGLPFDGAWSLKVVDDDCSDYGKLNSWSITGTLQ